MQTPQSKIEHVCVGWEKLPELDCGVVKELWLGRVRAETEVATTSDLNGR